MKKVFLLLSIITIYTISVNGQGTPEDMIKIFFNEYSKNPTNAVDNIYATNPWSSRIKDGIEAIKAEVDRYTIDVIGKYYGYELITKKQFSESFVLISYMVKYDRQPLRFTFKLYKPDNKWSLFSLNIDNELGAEIEEASKLYYLNL